jgi:hypothetical protein
MVIYQNVSPFVTDIRSISQGLWLTCLGSRTASGRGLSNFCEPSNRNIGETRSNKKNCFEMVFGVHMSINAHATLSRARQQKKGRGKVTCGKIVELNTKEAVNGLDLDKWATRSIHKMYTMLEERRYTCALERAATRAELTSARPPGLPCVPHLAHSTSAVAFEKAWYLVPINLASHRAPCRHMTRFHGTC